MNIEGLKKEILGKNYSLSVAYLSAERIKKINQTYRQKNKATSILSFTFADDFGEILLCPSLIRKEAKKRGRTFEEWLHALLVHGMLHLKGMKHSRAMEKMEKTYLPRIKF